MIIPGGLSHVNVCVRVCVCVCVSQDRVGRHLGFGVRSKTLPCPRTDPSNTPPMGVALAAVAAVQAAAGVD